MMKIRNMKNKLKVILICQFSNSEVRAHLPLGKRKIYSFIKKILGHGRGSYKYVDIASWNTNFINNLKFRDDVELTIVSSHTGMNKSQVHFEIDGVNYFFVNCDHAIMLKHIITNPKWWIKFNPMIPIVHGIVRKVEPDIVALMGAENPHYSSTILGLEKDYPCIFKAQTIYNNPDRLKYDNFNKINAYVEKQVFKRLPYASVSTRMHYLLYRKYRKDSYNFQWKFGMTFYPVDKTERKEFDFVNFAASVSEAKGYGDAIKALSIVKKTHPYVKLNLVGDQSTGFYRQCLRLVEELGLEDNVIFTPSFELQKEVFQHIQRARFALLPYKLDFISSTTWQSMYYEMPVICYRTMGPPTINKDKECILIADMNNIEMLAEKMNCLLDDPIKAEELRRNAKETVDAMNDGKKIADEIVRNFRAIVDNYKNGTAIPKEYLLDFDNYEL